MVALIVKCDCKKSVINRQIDSGQLSLQVTLLTAGDIKKIALITRDKLWSLSTL